MKKFIEVFNFKTGEVAKRIEVTGQSERMLDKLEMGLLRNMDLENWSTRMVEA